MEHLAEETCRDLYPYAVSKQATSVDVDEQGSDVHQQGSDGEQGLDVLDFGPTIRCILQDLAEGVDRGVISAKFHNSVAAAVETVCRRLRTGNALTNVVLSGGVFQNRLLLERCFERLERAGFEVYAHEKVPANDGGISLGQAVIAAARLAGSRERAVESRDDRSPAPQIPPNGGDAS